MSTNDVFGKMVNDAMEEVANKGWKNADPNAVTLASYGMLRKLMNDELHSIVRPIYWLAFAVGGGVIWLVIKSVLGIVG